MAGVAANTPTGSLILQDTQDGASQFPQLGRSALNLTSSEVIIHVSCFKILQSRMFQFYPGLIFPLLQSGLYPHLNLDSGQNACVTVIPTPSGSRSISYVLQILADFITYNSSDGPQPHFITIEFPRKVAIQVSK